MNRSYTLREEQADRVGKEAVAQGWAEEVNASRQSGGGQIEIGPCWDHERKEWMDVHRVRLTLPTSYGDVFDIFTADDWRRVKAKYDEMRQIVEEATQRGWEVFPRLKKQGRLGMYVDIMPRGAHNWERVGGLRTWRKLCREADSVIDGSEVVEPRALEA